MAERIISADSHFEIPIDKIVGYLPDKYKQEYTDHRASMLAQVMAAMAQQSTTPALRNKPAGISTVAQAPKLTSQPYPAAGRAGGSDPYERLKDMDIDKVDAEVLYLNFGDVDVFYDLSNEACSAGFQAFTSAALDVAAPDPDRLVPVYPLLLHDIDLTIKECQRIANQGGRAVMVPAYPTDFNLAPYHDEIYDPLWSALEDMEMPVSQHVNLKKSGREIGTWDPTPPKAIMQSLPPIFMAELLSSWVVTGIFDKHPKLKVVLVEAGIGWIPYYLMRLDKMQERHNWAARGLELPRRPSEYWFSNMAATFEEDVVGMKLLDELGEDNVMWATDYPHPDCTWPVSQDVLKEQFGAYPETIKNKITHQNAARIYKL
ncbi:MAG TPA: amidohydrolase family protein [Acidimicrobiales bacterium]|jgi:predicted TIM-barrel fold metal-dependent hydrolase